MDKHQAARAIIAQTLPLVPFEGWNQTTLNKAAVAAGYKKTDSIRVFPGGVTDAVDFYLTQADDEMVEALARYNLDTMKIRERVATAVRLWLEAQAPHKEALRKAMALQAIPFNTHHAVKSLYHTVDSIWHALGDSSTDFNFYTKRLMLAAVFSSTVLFWLDDKSAGYANTWAFLDRRIENVMSIEKAKGRLKRWLENAPGIFKRAG